MNKEESIECFKCDGSGLNKRGKTCKKCQGTGALSGPFFAALKREIEEQVRKHCEEEAKKLKGRGSDKNKVVHKGFICDGCEMDPIVGIRYKCTFRDNYDLCEKCERDLQPSNPHPMLKIRHPSQAPKALYCTYENITVHQK